MPYGFGRGFGFRGGSPPWPYVGRGRGGLPRCAYPGAAVAPPYYGWDPYYGAGPYAPPVSREDELAALRDEASVIKDHLEAIESRIRSLEGEEE